MKSSNALNLFIIILVLFVKQIGLAFIAPALKEMSTELTVSMYGITAAYLIGTAVGQILWGTLSDKYGRKILMTTGLLLYALTSIFVTFASTASFVVLLRFIQGASTGSMLGITIAIMADQYKKRSSLISAIAISELGFALAWTILPFLGGLTSKAGNWRINFYIMAFMVIIALIICLLFTTETRDKEYRKETTLKKTTFLFIEMFKRPSFLIIPILIGFVNLFFITFVTFGSNVMSKTFKFDSVTIGIAIGCLGFCFITAIIMNILVLKRFNSIKVVFSMSLSFLALTLLQLSFACLGILNIWTLLIPAALTLIVWVIMFPHIMSNGLMQYPKNSGTCASHIGFTYFMIAGIGTWLFSECFQNTFLGYTIFISLIALITLVIVLYWHKTIQILEH
jgi:MFS transporter, DHA1 family, multidrug resistance protein